MSLRHPKETPAEQESGMQSGGIPHDSTLGPGKTCRHLRHSANAGRGMLDLFSPFCGGDGRKYPLPGTFLTNPLAKKVRFGPTLPTMNGIT